MMMGWSITKSRNLINIICIQQAQLPGRISLQKRTDRNGLFTAVTRSKGWVRVLGCGEDMEILYHEFEEIRNHDFKLYFA